MFFNILSFYNIFTFRFRQLEIETRAEKVNKMQTEFPVTSEVREYMLKVQDIPMDQIAYTLGTSLSIESSLRTMSLRAVPSESSGINVMDTAVVVGGMIRHTTSTSSLSSRGQQISESSQHSQSQKQDREVAGIHSTPVNKQSSNVTVHYTDTPTSGNAVLIGTPDTKRDSTVSEIDSPRIIIPSINRTGFKASGAANVIRNLQSDPSPIMTTPVKILPSATTINKDTYISPDSKSERGTSSAPARPNIQVTPFRVVPGPRSAITPGTGTTKASDTAGTPLAVTSTTTVATSKVTPTTPDRDFGVQLVPVSVTASATATDSSSHSNSHSQAASTSNSPDKFRGTYQQVATHPTNTAIITTTTTAPTTAPFATATATTATTTTNSFTGDNNKYDTLLTNEALESELFKAPEELQPTSLLFHSSDNLIQPIVGNSSIEIIDKQTIQAAQLVNSFAVLAADRMKQMTVEQIDVHLGTVYKALLKCTTTTTTTSSISPVQSKAGLQSNTSSSNSSNNSIAYQTSLLIERTNILLYLLSISSVEEVASRLMQPPHVGLILRSVCQKSSSQPVSSVGMRGGETAAISLHTQGATTTAVSSWNACRVLATDVLANCIRYSKEISPLTFTPRSVATPSTVTLASASTQGGLLYILVSILQTEINMDAILKRRMVAAVGELLFYISTQQEPLEENVVPSTSITSARPSSRTQVASSNSSSSSSGAYSQLSMRRNRSENSLNKAPKGTMSSATNINTNKVVDPNKWQMPCSLTEFLRSLLQPSGDEVLTHYVAKVSIAT